ncbi:MAG: FkbM family methyltransferase [Gemmobacter sp.]
MTHAALAPFLRFKHRIATSPLAGPVGLLRGLHGRLRAVLHPELGLLHQEPRLTDACLAKLIRPDWNCLDIGGHLGSVSYTLANLAPRGKLHIVEASPAKAAALRARFPKATVHAVAVSDHQGEAVFYENVVQPGFSSLTNRTSRGDTREVRVTMARIDDLWPADLPLHFLKIDVEGHEYAALKGAEATLARHRPVILFEAGAVEDRDVNADSYDDLHTYLTDMGYAIRPVFHQHFGREPVSLDAFRACRLYPFTAFNFFAVPTMGAGQRVTS